MTDPWLFVDYNSTTPLDPDVAAEMQRVQAVAWGNPSSIHASGRAAKAALEEARARAAAVIRCDPGELYFTSGGTESDHLAIKGCYFGNPRRPRHVVVSAIEHPAVIAAAEDLRRAGAAVTHARCTAGGVVTPELLREAIGDGAVICSVMAANNETGVIQPVAELAAAAREEGALFHTDAVQAVGKIPVDVSAWKVDLLALTAHKFYGPRGIGALFIRRGVAVAPQITGGSHERNRRAGTENVVGAWGLAVALERAASMQEREAARLAGLSGYFMDRMTAEIPDVHINGDPSLRLSNTVNVSFRGVEGEAVVVSLDLKGICVASGSACSSGATEPSHVILALGHEPTLAAGAVRFSFGRATTREDVDRLLVALRPEVQRLRALSPGYAGRAV
jgi:cysteine desulfurase